jgi:hypothetical protein
MEALYIGASSQPFVRPRVAPQKGFLYVKKLDELLKALSGKAFSPMLRKNVFCYFYTRARKKSFFPNCLKCLLSNIFSLFNIIEAYNKCKVTASLASKTKGIRPLYYYVINITNN